MARFVVAAMMQLKMARRSLRWPIEPGTQACLRSCGCTTEKEEQGGEENCAVHARCWSPATHLFAELEIGLALLAARVDIVVREAAHHNVEIGVSKIKSKSQVD
jgi:hypothetical protein